MKRWTIRERYICEDVAVVLANTRRTALKRAREAMLGSWASGNEPAWIEASYTTVVSHQRPLIEEETA